jgi:hypothetical protein
MGYYTSVTGQIDISPPLTWNEIKDSPFLPESVARLEWRDVMLNVEVDINETDEGTLTRRYANAVVPSTDDSFKAYDIEDHLAELVRLHGDGRTFTGRLEGHGEETSDMWRLCIRDGKVAKDVPRIVWPDGDERTAGR